MKGITTLADRNRRARRHDGYYRILFSRLQQLLDTQERGRASNDATSTSRGAPRENGSRGRIRNRESISDENNL